MVERRSHVPARLHETKGQGHRELSGVDRPSHINVFGQPTTLARQLEAVVSPREFRY